MEKQRFWEIIRKINWSYNWKFKYNKKICRKKMLEACSQDELKEFEEMAHDMYSKLEECIKDNYQIDNNGNFNIMCPDGFSLFTPNGCIHDGILYYGLWHIVGRGKTIYEKVMKNPYEFWKAFKDVVEMIHTECFCYIFFENNDSLPEDKQIQLALDAVHKQFGVDENDIIAEMKGDMVDVFFDDNHYKIMVWPEEDGSAAVQIYKPTFGPDGLINTIRL